MHKIGFWQFIQFSFMPPVEIVSTKSEQHPYLQLFVQIATMQPEGNPQKSKKSAQGLIALCVRRRLQWMVGLVKSCESI